MVDALVAQVAAACFTDRVPFAVRLPAHPERLERGTAPEALINQGRNGLRASHLADAAARLTMREQQGKPHIDPPGGDYQNVRLSDR